MVMSPAALWLNMAFAGFDSFILDVLHNLANSVGGILTPIMRLITLLGEKGIIFFLLALVFLCFSKTRKMGICIFGAVCCGALITNVVLKDMIARPRPFETVEVFKQWWTALGSPAEDGYSFPSGHVTAAAAGMTALCLTKGKKMILPSVIVVFLMAVSRNYLMAHYPSDVLFAAIIGCASAFIAYVITVLIYRFVNDHEDMKVCSYVLDFDMPLPVLAIGSFARSRSKKSAEKTTEKSSGNVMDKSTAKSTGKTAIKSTINKGGYKGKHEG